VVGSRPGSRTHHLLTPSSAEEGGIIIPTFLPRKCRSQTFSASFGPAGRLPASVSMSFLDGVQVPQRLGN
jgi:hypothetical protein